jgi:hypothetical protein
MSKFRGSPPKPAKFGTPSGPPPIVDTDRLPPVFSFEYMEDGKGFSINCCEEGHQAALAAKLFLLSRMTWMQIRNAPRHGLGTEKIARNAIKPPIPAKITQDADFLALRYNGKCPMIGFRDGRVFHIVFIDHTMTAYNH